MSASKERRRTEVRQSNDKVKAEKMAGQRASWELPDDVPFEAVHQASAGNSEAPGLDRQAGIPANYESSHVSYQDENHFEVKPEPGRLG